MQGNVIEDQLHENHANEAYQDDKNESHVSNGSTGVINDPQYEADHTNGGNNNQSYQPDEEYTTDTKTDTEIEEDRHRRTGRQNYN